jgi:thiamine kinase
MAPALPRHIQFKLEQTLAQWPQWHCTPALARTPDVVRILTPGISNFSVLVESGQRFVVRIDGLNPSANGLSRQTEWRTLEEAHKAGLAPHPRYFNPELGSLVCDYLAPEDAHGQNITDVAHLLRAIHQLPARHHRLDLAERVLRYEKQLEHRGRAVDDGVRGCQDKVSQLLYEASQHAVETVLCHNDLLRANRICSGGRLWALDWEYCAMGSPWYDLAVVINGDALVDTDSDVLIETYLGRIPDTRERDTLHLYGCIYRYLELLWYLALDKPVLEVSAIEEKSATLRNMLSAGYEFAV